MLNDIYPDTWNLTKKQNVWKLIKITVWRIIKCNIGNIISTNEWEQVVCCNEANLKAIQRIECGYFLKTEVSQSNMSTHFLVFSTRKIYLYAVNYGIYEKNLEFFKYIHFLYSLSKTITEIEFRDLLVNWPFLCK